MNKSFNLILTIVISACAISCSKDYNNSLSRYNNENGIYNFETKTYTDDILSFQSKEEMMKIAGDISIMNEIEFEEWKSIYPEFTSLNEIYADAIEDVVKLAEITEATGKLDMSLMTKFKGHYYDYLLFNDDPADEEMFCPYSPFNNTIYGNVTNKNGEVIVDGEKINLRELKSVKDSWYYKISHNITRGKNKNEVTEDDNRLYIGTKDRKMWAEVVRITSNDNTAIELTAKKKVLFGWSNYATRYHCSFISWDSGSWYYKPILIEYCERTEHITPQSYSGLQLSLAKPKDKKYGIAKFRMWTDGTGSYNVTGILNVKISGKGLPENAIHIR